MTAREHIDDIHASARKFKEDQWYQSKKRDINVQCAAFFDDGNRYFFPIDMVASLLDQLYYEKGKRINNWPTALEASLHLGMQAMLGLTSKQAPAVLFGSQNTRPKPGTKLRAVFVTCESFICPPDYEAEIGVEDQEDGDRRLADDFANNPNSRIQETLMTFVIEDDLCGGVEWAGAIQQFHFDDGGVIAWDDPSYVISDTEDLEPEWLEAAKARNIPLRAIIPYFHQEVQAKEQP